MLKSSFHFVKEKGGKKFKGVYDYTPAERFCFLVFSLFVSAQITACNENDCAYLNHEQNLTSPSVLLEALVHVCR